MKLKWCILLGILSLIGIATQQQLPMPNQEIVLRFSSEEVATEEAKNAIAIVKDQLVALGAINIQVREIDKGDLKLIYYINADVDSIKDFLTQENTIALGYIVPKGNANNSEIPSKEKHQTYDIDVFEIKSHERGFDLARSHGLKQKHENTHFEFSCVFILSKDIHSVDLENLFTERFKFRKNSAIAIEITSKKIPDGRAGPNHTSV